MKLKYRQFFIKSASILLSEGASQKEIHKNLQLLSMVQSNSFGTLHLQLFHHKVSSGCVHSCNLPPTSGSARLHSLYNYMRSNCGTDGNSHLYIAMAHQERQMMVIAINRLPAPSCLPDAINPLCMQNWIQHTPLWVLQIWTRVFLVMWWLQRTPLLKYHITRSWQIL